MNEQENKLNLLELTSRIVAAHVTNNSVSIPELPKLITAVHEALAASNNGELVESRPEPAVPITESITPDYIVCLEDGKKLKMLKRHLRARYNMSPEDYRDRWRLPLSYPMVAPNYAKHRSSLAKTIGLGNRGRRPRK